jgi:hypothetical protein
MPNLTDTLEAVKNSQLLSRATAALQKIATEIVGTSPASPDQLAWARRAWLNDGAQPRLQWYAQRMLEFAAHQSADFKAAIDANREAPDVSDAGIIAFARQYVAILVANNI